MLNYKRKERNASTFPSFIEPLKTVANKRKQKVIVLLAKVQTVTFFCCLLRFLKPTLQKLMQTLRIRKYSWVFLSGESQTKKHRHRPFLMRVSHRLKHFYI